MPDASEMTTLAERFSLDDIITGLAADLAALRAGTISTRDAKVRADLAHEILRGIDLTVKARKLLIAQAKTIGEKTNG